MFDFKDSPQTYINLAGDLIDASFDPSRLKRKIVNREEKAMPYYETVFIARQDLTDSQVEQLTETMCQVIKDQGSKVIKTEKWGLRSLAYRIKKNRKGHYILIETDGSSAAVIEMDRLLGLNEDVLRSMTIRLDEPSSEPSPVMRTYKKDNDKSNKEAA